MKTVTIKNLMMITLLVAELPAYTMSRITQTGRWYRMGGRTIAVPKSAMSSVHLPHIRRASFPVPNPTNQKASWFSLLFTGKGYTQQLFETMVNNLNQGIFPSLDDVEKLSAKITIDNYNPINQPIVGNSTLFTQVIILGLFRNYPAIVTDTTKQEVIKRLYALGAYVNANESETFQSSCQSVFDAVIANIRPSFLDAPLSKLHDNAKFLNFLFEIGFVDISTYYGLKSDVDTKKIIYCAHIAPLPSAITHMSLNQSRGMSVDERTHLFAEKDFQSWWTTTGLSDFDDFLKRVTFIENVQHNNSYKQQKIDNKSNPYQVLGIDLSATIDDIKAAYRKLAKKYHPDRNTTNKEEAAKKFLEVQNAYEVLMEKYQRATE